MLYIYITYCFLTHNKGCGCLGMDCRSVGSRHWTVYTDCRAVCCRLRVDLGMRCRPIQIHPSFFECLLWCVACVFFGYHLWFFGCFCFCIYRLWFFGCICFCLCLWRCDWGFLFFAGFSESKKIGFETYRLLLENIRSFLGIQYKKIIFVDFLFCFLLSFLFGWVDLMMVVCLFDVHMGQHNPATTHIA